MDLTSKKINSVTKPIVLNFEENLIEMRGLKSIKNQDFIFSPPSINNENRFKIRKKLSKITNSKDIILKISNYTAMETNNDDTAVAYVIVPIKIPRMNSVAESKYNRYETTKPQMMSLKASTETQKQESNESQSNDEIG